MDKLKKTENENATHAEINKDNEFNFGESSTQLDKIKDSFNQTVYKWGVKLKKEVTQIFTSKLKE